MQLQITTRLIVFLLIMLTPWLLVTVTWMRWNRAGRPGRFKVGEALISWLLGIVGGGLCGAATWPFFDRLDPISFESSAYFGAYIGAILGAFVTPFAYPYLIRRIGVRKAFLPSMIGTLLGGFLALSVVEISAPLRHGDTPPALFIVPVGIIVLFFFGALRWTMKKEARSHPIAEAPYITDPDSAKVGGSKTEALKPEREP